MIFVLRFINKEVDTVCAYVDDTNIDKHIGL